MSSTTTNMGLTIWNTGSDHFSRTQLSDNWDAIDEHDHTSGKGLQIPTGGIANGAVTTVKVADSNVTTAKIADSNVTEVKMATGSNGLAKGSFRVHLANNQAISASTNTTVAYDTATFNVGSWMDITTNKGRYTPQVAGYYFLSGSFKLVATSLTADTYVTMAIYKNGTPLAYGPVVYARGSAISPIGYVSMAVQANGSTDYFEFRAYQTDGSQNIVGSTLYTYASGFLIGRS